MFGFKPGTVSIIRIALIAVILFNALGPSAMVAQAKEASTLIMGSSSQTVRQENRSVPTLERPEPELANLQMITIRNRDLSLMRSLKQMRLQVLEAI